MKILEITNYTSGGCGVGMRVLEESKLLAGLNHKVQIFSTNKIKGTKNTCKGVENIGNVLIKRFPALKLGGDSFMKWSFAKDAIKFKPDIIITHSYRHLHTTQALKIAKILRCKVFLVTHAPFGREESRSWFENKVVWIYDKLFGKIILNKFDKIVTITNWEKKYLYELGVKKNKLEYIPNWIRKEFFKPIKKLSRPLTKICYFGRISRIKQIEDISKALSLKINSNWVAEITGPAESDYLQELEEMIYKKGLVDKEFIYSKNYDLKEQIKGLDKSQVFVFPSKSEGMPQSLVEAMARGKIVVCSDNQGNKELVKDRYNGFIFKKGDPKDLAKVLDKLSSLSQDAINNIQKQARRRSEIFKVESVKSRLINLLN